MDRFEDAKLRVKEATDLVALIESYLPLKPRGRYLIALCPFHPEKTPSFTVYPDSQHFHCYGCGKAGDVFTFLMEREGLSFREAMETLADRAKISLDGVFGRGDQTAPRGPDPTQVLGEVRSFFQAALFANGGAVARSYLEGRGLGAAIEPWALGFHPSRPGALQRFAQERRLPRDILEAAGLLRGNREPFAGRVLFPIEDERGRTVGFGGRLVPGLDVARSDSADYAPPKYLNSPESPFFNKRRVLFGLHRAKQAGSRRIVVMEGYTDVIASHLAGFTGAVATLGTAFTRDHARTVERYATEGLVLLFDGDRAGFQAAERAMRELVNSRLPVRIALMADAKDPGDFLVARAGEDPDLVTERRARFADLLDGAEAALPMWFRLLRRRLDLSQAVHVEAAARECGTLLALVDNDLRRAALLDEMARHLAMPVAALERMLPKVAARREDPATAAGKASAAAPTTGAGTATTGTASAGTARSGPPVPPARARLGPVQQAELDLLACVLRQPALAAQVGDESFVHAAAGALMALARQAIAAGRSQTDELLRFVFALVQEQPELQRTLAEAADRSNAIPDPAAFFAGLQQGRRRLSTQQHVRNLRQRLQAATDAGDAAAVAELTRALVDALRQDRPRAAPAAAATASPPTPERPSP